MDDVVTPDPGRFLPTAHDAELGSARHEVGVLYEAAALLGRTLDPSRVYDILHSMIARVMDCDTLFVSEYDPTDNAIRCVYAWIEGSRVDAASLPTLTLAPVGQGMQSQVIRTGRSLRINDRNEQDRTGSTISFVESDGQITGEPGPTPAQSLLLVPLLLDERVLGTAQVMSLQAHAYTDAHLHFLEALLTQVAAAARNAFLYQQAQSELTERRRVETENARLLEQLREGAGRQRAFLRDVLSSVTGGRLQLCDSEANLPTPRDWQGEALPLSSESLRELRRQVREAGVLQGLTELCGNDLVMAASEAAMNAVVHAGGGEARVAANEGCVQVWVWDTGSGIDVVHLPRATLERGYTTAGTFGHGFKMMLQIADRVWLLTGVNGTTVVLERGKEDYPLP